jgi:hypothetical protein
MNGRVPQRNGLVMLAIERELRGDGKRQVNKNKPGTTTQLTLLACHAPPPNNPK